MNSIEYYLNKGFDQKYAEYFASGRKKIVSVVPGEDKTLILGFNNGERRILDMTQMIQPGTVFAFLEDNDNFKRVYLDNKSCVSWDIDPDIDSEVVWDNKVDLCPDNCYMDSLPLN